VRVSVCVFVGLCGCVCRYVVHVDVCLRVRVYVKCISVVLEEWSADHLWSGSINQMVRGVG